MQNPFKEYLLPLSAIVLAIGVVLQTISVLGLWFRTLIPQLKDTLEQVGYWNLWLLFIAPFVIITGGYYFGDEVYKRREFNKLIKIKSKRDFITNVDRLEELAFLLTKYHRNVLNKKKKEFRI